jgi:Sensors of blue-light using FAD
MILVRLTFFSRNRLCYPNELAAEVAVIAATSNSNNMRDGITGALVYDRRWFAQVLEGAETPVSETFERILRDWRHSDVSLITMQPVIKRLYDGHPLKVVALGEADDIVRHYCEREEFDPRRMRADRIADLIEAVAAEAGEVERRCHVAH